MSSQAANFTQEGAYDVVCYMPVEFRKQLQVDFQLSPNNFSPLPPSTSTKLGFVSVCSLILLVGLVANVLIIIWIANGKPKRTSIDIFVVSLSVTDLLTVITIIPLQIALLFVDSNWNLFPQSHAPALCKASAYFQTATICISVLTLEVIAIDRYIAVCHPLYHYKIKDRRRNISLGCTAAIWILGLLIGINDAIEVRISQSLDDGYRYKNFGYETNEEFLSDEIAYVPDVAYYEEYHELIPGVMNVNETCVDINLYGFCMPKTRISNTALFVLMYVIPLLVLAFCYISISHKLWIRKPVSDSAELSPQSAPIKHSVRKMTIIMMVMVIAFGLLWLPYWCKKMYETHAPRRPPGEVVKFDSVDLSFNILTYLCIISSPFIYISMDRAFQKRVALKVRFLVERIKPSLAGESGRLSSHIDTSKSPTAANKSTLTANNTLPTGVGNA